MDNGIGNIGPAQFDPQALLREEVQNLSRRVEALIKWTEEFEESIIFVGKSEQKEKSPETRNEGGGSPWEGESLDFKIGATEDQNTSEGSDLDMFGASPQFAEWKAEEEQAEKAEEATPVTFSLLQWD